MFCRAEKFDKINPSLSKNKTMNDESYFLRISKIPGPKGSYREQNGSRHKIDNLQGKYANF